MKRRIVASFVGLMVSGCAYYPKAVEHYDQDCQIYQKRLVMAKSSYGMARTCSNEGCVAALLSIPAEALVVGSVVFVGNTVLWMEKEGRCLLK